MEQLKTSISVHEAKLKEYDNCDIQKVQEYDEAIEVAKDAAERWTDNVYALCKLMKAKMSFTEKETLKRIGISDPDNFDYLE